MIILAVVIVFGGVWWFVSGRPQQRRQRIQTDMTRGVPAPVVRRRVLAVGPPVVGAVVEFVGVTKAYGRRRALDELDLAVPAGGVFGLLGQNGAGKTTALRCVLGLVRPTSGVCRILGADSGRDLHTVIGRVGALIETPGLTPTISGRRNLALLARLDKIGPAGVDRALRTAGLADRADDAVNTYSLGMRQRLGIAAALLRDPEVVVLDEPANGLDPAGIADIRRLLRGLAAEGRTVIVSSHLLDEVEKTCDRVAVIDAGRCVASGPIEHVLATAGVGTLIVGVADLHAGRDALANAGIEAVLADGNLRVSHDATDAARVTEILAAKGLYVNEMRHERPTLEAVFFGLTSGKADR
ncbi:MAG TPA: ATP-binding cassette domain-containing protein [Acidothermaceae bacterium]